MDVRLVSYRVKDIAMWVDGQFFAGNTEFNAHQAFVVSPILNGMAKAELSFSMFDLQKPDKVTIGLTLEAVFAVAGQQQDVQPEIYKIMHALCQSKLEDLCGMARVPTFTFPYIPVYSTGTSNQETSAQS